MSATSLIDDALAALSPGARAYYGTHLEHDPDTRRIVGLIVSMAEQATQADSRAALELAAQAALLHRAGVAGEDDEDEEIDLSRLPFALELELERVLSSWRRDERVRRHCRDRDERAAAAVLALADAWHRRRSAPGWVWDHLADVGLSESDLAALVRELDR